MFKLSEVTLPVLLTCSLVSLSLILYLINRNKRNYVRVGRVAKLVVHPVKSCRGIEVDHLRVTKSGVQYGQFRDRGWVVIDGKGSMVNLIAGPKLVTVRTMFEGDHLVLESAEGARFPVLVRTQVGPEDVVVDMRIYNQDMRAIDCGPEVAKFLSELLGIQGARLVQYVEQFNLRPSRSEGKRDKKTEERYRAIFQNYSNVHITTENSLAELNEQILKNSGPDKQVTTSHFRSNILVEDSLSFDEDHWQYLKIGHDTTELFQMQNCPRCTQTTVGRDDASRGQEPLHSLKKFRQATHPDDKKRLGDKPLFGSIFATISEGTVAVGDEIYAHRVDHI